MALKRQHLKRAMFMGRLGKRKGHTVDSIVEHFVNQGLVEEAADILELRSELEKAWPVFPSPTDEPPKWQPNTFTMPTRSEDV